MSGVGNNANGGGYGQQDPSDTSSEFNQHAFAVDQALARVRTAMLVSVNACSNSGGVSPIGTVDVTPLVNMLDGQGNSQAHGKIFKLPYFRLQGGKHGAVICDPVKGDVGVALICDRDISAVKSSNGQAANPGSYRKFSPSDGLFIGCFLGQGTPDTYIQFDGQGNVNIVDKNGNKIQTAQGGITLVDSNGNQIQTSSNGVAITGNLSVTGTLSASGNITANQGGGSQVEFANHTHSGVTAGGGTSGPPTPGS